MVRQCGKMAIVLSGIVGGCNPAGLVMAAEVAPDRSSSISDVEMQIREAHVAFWDAFNSCDAEGMARFFTEDVEFYHDREGMNQSREAVTASMLSGPCADGSELRLRREGLAADEEFHPLAGGYAILSGTHRFYSRQDDGPERHDTIARYWSVWEETPEGWQMRRVVSFDHRADVPELHPILLSPAQLQSYVGQYQTEGGPSLNVNYEDGALQLEAGARFALVPTAEHVFGTEGRWLEFHFSSDRLEIFEEGNLVANGQRASE